MDGVVLSAGEGIELGCGWEGLARMYTVSSGRVYGIGIKGIYGVGRVCVNALGLLTWSCPTSCSGSRVARRADSTSSGAMRGSLLPASKKAKHAQKNGGWKVDIRITSGPSAVYGHLLFLIPSSPKNLKSYR